MNNLKTTRSNLEKEYRQEKISKVLTVKRILEYYLPLLNELGIINKNDYLETLNVWKKAQAEQGNLILVLFWNHINWYMTDCWRLANGHIKLDSFHEQKEMYLRMFSMN